MHVLCSLKDMQAAYIQSPHFCDIYNVLMFNRYPRCKKATEKLQQAMFSQYVVQGGLLYIYMKKPLENKNPYDVFPHQKLIFF